ncbi:amino acid adenylation domain-containing protein [Sorangium sp. So ce118]
MTTERPVSSSEFARLPTEEKKRVLLRLREERASSVAAPGGQTGGHPRDAAPLRPVISARPGDRFLPFPLTPIQESFLVAKQLDRGSDPVGCHIYLEIEEAGLDVPRLERAWDRLVAHHDMLRASVFLDGTQKVHEHGEPRRFQVDDLRELRGPELAAHLEAVRDSMSHRVYGPGASPLHEIRVSRCRDDRSLIHLSIDEWIVDAASVNLLLAQWYRLYHDPEAVLPRCELTFRDYVLALRAFEQAPAYKADLAYWCDKLATMPAGPALPGAEPSQAPQGRAGHARRRVHGRLPREPWSALKDRSTELGVSPTALLLTVFSEALALHCPPGPFSLTLTYFNRPPIHADIERLLGPLISAHRFLVEHLPDLPLQEKVQRNQQQLWRDLDHDRSDSITASRALKARRNLILSSPIVFTSVISNVGKEAQRQGRSWADQITHSVTQTPQVYLDHQVSEKDGDLHFTWDVVDAVFSPGLIDAVFDDYMRLLRALAAEDRLWTSFRLRDELRDLRPRLHGGPERPSPAPRGDGFQIVARPEERHRRFPLSDLQQAYFVGRTALMSNGGVSCQMYQDFELRAPDIAKLERAWQRVVDTHEMLRAVVHSDGTQSIRAEAVRYTIQVADYRGHSPEARAAALAEVREAMVAKVFPLDGWPFFDVRLSLTEPSRAILHVSIDLLIADAVSIHTVFKQFFALYQQPDAPCSAPALSFRDYQLALKEHERAPAYPIGAEHWRRRLTDLPGGPELGLRLPEDGDRRLERRELHGVLTRWSLLQERAAALRVSAETVLLGVYIEVLGSRSTRHPFTVVAVRWDRPPVHPEIDEVVGDFTAISWVASPQGGTFAERLQHLELTLAEDRAHRLISGPRMLQQLARRSRQRQFLTFPVVFTGLAPTLRGVLPDSVALGHRITQTPQVFLDNISVEVGDSLQLHWDSVQGVFPEGLIESMFDAYCRILDLLARDGDAWQEPRFDAVLRGPAAAPLPGTAAFEPGRAAVLPPGEAPGSGERSPRSSRSSTDARHLTSLHRLIEERALGCPDRPAVVFEGEELTYRELNRRANKTARYLRKHGVGPDRLVGVLAERSIEMVVGLLAILKAGGAYVPIDPTYPLDRIEFIAEDADISVLLTQERHRLPGFRGAQLCLDTQRSLLEGEAEHDLGQTAGPEDLAYVIYTSGSTGKPKGCMISHLAICNRLIWMQDEYRLQPTDRVLQKTPYTFDVSVWEFFLPLIAGATLVMARPEGHKDAAYLARVMEEQRITTCHFVPSMLNFFLRSPVLPSHLRQVFTSGEALPYELVETFLRRSTARLHNLYGPTEAAVDVTYWQCEIRPDRKVPIGRAIDHVELHILDDDLRPVPAGAEGELHIGGVCLARGYLNRPELTREKFIQSPFDPGGRLYKTGDRARYLEDGNIEFLGRLDSQVKLRGFRIELGEIEAVLCAHEDVKDAVVVVREAQTEDPRLVAYVVAGDRPCPGPGALRAYLKDRLPEYMVPNQFVPLPELPVTAHGKLDRKALPWPAPRSAAAAAAPQAAAEPEPPAPAAPPAPAVDPEPAVRDELQRFLGGALRLDHVDADADLFDLGATSLTVVQASQRIQECFGVELPVSVVLATPTLGAVARHVVGQMTAGARVPPAAAPSAAAPPRPAATPAAAVAAPARAPAPAAGPSAGTDAEAPLNFFSKEDRDRLKQRELHLRNDLAGLPAVDLLDAPAAPEVYRERASRHDYQPRPIPLAAFSSLLSLLRRYPSGQRTQFCYPSAGGTYAVQTYVHVKEGAIEGLDPGLYYHHPERNQLVLINARFAIRRAHHFYYNREHFDRAGFGLFFIAQTDALRPIYGDSSFTFAAIEAGCMIQLLMSHQARTGLGLCPMGGLDFDAISADFKLGSGHRYVLCMLGGRVDHARGPADDRAKPGQSPRDHGPPALVAAPADRRSPAPAVASGSRDVAVIGLAGRYPGAETPRDLWRLLSEGRSAITRAPAARAGAAGEGGDPGWGGFLPRIDAFDSLFFNISPAEARHMDPQERLFVEVVWECLENAGYTPQELTRSAPRVGVFAGVMWSDYQSVGLEAWQRDGRAQAVTLHSSICNRISHLFDFQGPSAAIDTSCSSALTALHLACRSLQRGECDVALVGGVNLLGHPSHRDLLAALNLTSGDDRTRAFGAGGTGWVPGEGVGAVLLRRLQDAEQHGDFIHGVVKGTAVAHAGKTSRYGMPNTQAQAGSIRAALADAELAAEDIDYVECAATGSGLADAAEVSALRQAFQERSPDGPPCALGSIKPNIGHLESASGISQLIKVLLQLEHGQIAPTLYSEPRNPLIQLDRTPFRINQELAPWPGSAGAASSPRRALVNAFGATGSSAHAVVEEYGPRRPGAPAGPAGPRVFVLSAETAEQLDTHARALADHLRDLQRGSQPPGAAPPAATDVAYTLLVGRRAMDERLAIVASDLDELEARLRDHLAGRRGQDGEHVFRGRSGARAEAAPPPGAPPAALARAWVHGAPVAFQDLHGPGPRRRVPLPTYPFACPSHWLARPPQPAGAATAAELPAAEPAPQRRAAEDAPAAPSAPTADPALRQAALRLVCACFSEAAEIPRQRLDPEAPLDRYGLNSLLAVQLTRLLEAQLGALPRTLVYEHNTLASLAEGLIARHGDALLGHLGRPRAAPATRAPALPAQASGASRAAEAALPSADIAIVGLTGRYPGADTIDAFWQNLQQGRDCVTEVPEGRWGPVAAGPQGSADAAPRRRWGGFLGNVDRFDPLFFNISPREAAAMDPQERLFLQTAWGAFEDAGYTRQRLAEDQARQGAGVGVFVGSMYQHYPLLARDPAAEASSSFWSIANRVSYFFDLRGPSFAVDAACASSLTAIHLACESLRRGESCLALAGGVNLHLHPDKYAALERLGLLSSGAASKSLGDGDGYVPGEAVGAVVLKPLDRALADNDRIYGVIKGSFTSHAGRTVGYGVPSPAAQADLIATALRRSGVHPDTIGYVEVAANGSSVGDAIELAGLQQAFRRFTDRKRFCAVGSVKSNIGHPEAASGIAQLTKVLCQLQHRTLVPTLHAEPLNPDIALDDSPFYVQRALGPWPAPLDEEGGRPCPRRAALSSFGSGGTSTHIVVEEYADPEGAAQPTQELAGGAPLEPAAFVLPVSARTREQLCALAAALAHDIERRMRPGSHGERPLTDRDLPAIAHTLQIGREAMAERLAVVTTRLVDLVAKLRRFAGGDGDVEDVYLGSAATAGPGSLLDGREGEAFLAILLEDGRYDKLARLWVSGAPIDWRRLHGSGRAPRPLSLPSYPFASERFWIAERPRPLPPRAEPPAPGRGAEPAPARDSVAEARGPIEQEVTAMLCDVLQLDDRHVEPDREFRDYGLDSRLSVAFMRSVQQRFGPRVALTAAHAHPTLSRLTAYLHRTLANGHGASRSAPSAVASPPAAPPASIPPVGPRASSAPSPGARPAPRDVTAPLAPGPDPMELVSINPSGARQSSFWVHGAPGLAQPFVHLSAALGGDYPLFAFQARGMDGSVMPFTSIEETAAYYIACMQQRRSTGPYFLGGLSSGGIIAFEMARQLQQKGEAVSRLVLLDTYPSVGGIMESTPENSDPTFHNLLMANSFLSFNLSGEVAIRPADVADLAPEHQLPRIVRLIKERSGTALALDQIYRQLTGSIAVYRHLDLALKSYEPRPLDAVDVLFFRAENGFFGGSNPLDLPLLDALSGYDAVTPWRQWLNGSLRVVGLPCAHVEIMDPPALERVVAHLREDLA